jgi:integrase
MSLYKRGNIWWAKVSVKGHKPVSQSTGTRDKQKAAEYEARLKAQIWEQVRLGIKPRYIWQEAVVRYCQETSDKKSHKTDLLHFRWLRHYLDGKYLDEITRDLAEKIIADKKKEGVQNATVNRIVGVVTRVLRKAALEWEWLDKAPKFRVLPEPKVRVRWLTYEEAARLLQELPEHLSVMAAFSLETGLRQGNVTGLLWSQVNLEKKHAYIRADQAKGGKAIPVPLSDGAIKILRVQRFKHQTHVFTYKGKPIRQVSTKAWWAALERAGITDFRWHDLRHTWASWHIQNGTPLYALQSLGGWQDLDMVQKYAHLSSEHLSPFVERVSGLSATDRTDLATKQLHQHAG